MLYLGGITHYSSIICHCNWRRRKYCYISIVLLHFRKLFYHIPKMENETDMQTILVGAKIARL